MRKALLTLRGVVGAGGVVVGAAALVFVGYIVVRSIPDMQRYIKISTM